MLLFRKPLVILDQGAAVSLWVHEGQISGMNGKRKIWNTRLNLKY